MSGMRFSKLTVVEFAYYNGKKTFWKCLCDCGKEKNISRDDLLHAVKSCGCSQKKIHNYEWFLFNHYKKGARERNIIFNIAFSNFIILINSDCHYCGSSPQKRKHTFKGKARVYSFGGIDRKDNNIGYEINNIVPCCMICNRAKRELSYSDFFLWISRLINSNITNSLVA